MEKLWGWPILLISVWLVVLLCMPFVERAWGEKAFHRSIVLSVFIQSGIVVFLLVRAAGMSATALMAGKVVLLTWGIEAVGAATSFPFGDYRYTDHLQPQVLGVPVLIPFAWLMMLPPSWAAAQRISGSQRGLAFIILSALAFTAWDLFLDPQMVKWGLWVWEPTSGYFGIPWINFAGWILAAALITALVRPPKLPERPLLLIYSITWLMEAAGLKIFWNLSGPALSGFIGMGVFVLLSLYSGRAQRRRPYGQAQKAS
jgi:putative membrane protein